MTTRSMNAEQEDDKGDAPEIRQSRERAGTQALNLPLPELRRRGADTRTLLALAELDDDTITGMLRDGVAREPGAGESARWRQRSSRVNPARAVLRRGRSRPGSARTGAAPSHWRPGRCDPAAWTRSSTTCAPAVPAARRR